MANYDSSEEDIPVRRAPSRRKRKAPSWMKDNVHVFKQHEMTEVGPKKSRWKRVKPPAKRQNAPRQSLVYRCPAPGCDKWFSSRNGLHYHVRRAAIHADQKLNFTILSSGTVILASGTDESEEDASAAVSSDFELQDGGSTEPKWIRILRGIAKMKVNNAMPIKRLVMRAMNNCPKSSIAHELRCTITGNHFRSNSAGVCKRMILALIDKYGEGGHYRAPGDGGSLPCWIQSPADFPAFKFNHEGAGMTLISNGRTVSLRPDFAAYMARHDGPTPGSPAENPQGSVAAADRPELVVHPAYFGRGLSTSDSGGGVRYDKKPRLVSPVLFGRPLEVTDKRMAIMEEGAELELVQPKAGQVRLLFRYTLSSMDSLAGLNTFSFRDCKRAPHVARAVKAIDVKRRKARAQQARAEDEGTKDDGDDDPETDSDLESEAERSSSAGSSGRGRSELDVLVDTMRQVEATGRHWQRRHRDMLTCPFVRVGMRELTRAEWEEEMKLQAHASDDTHPLWETWKDAHEDARRSIKEITKLTRQHDRRHPDRIPTYFRTNFRRSASARRSRVLLGKRRRKARRLSMQQEEQEADRKEPKKTKQNSTSGAENGHTKFKKTGTTSMTGCKKKTTTTGKKRRGTKKARAQTQVNLQESSEGEAEESSLDDENDEVEEDGDESESTGGGESDAKDKSPTYDAMVVGRRVRVQDNSRNKSWEEGRITRFRSRGGRHQVTYDGGKVEWVVLSSRQFSFIGSASDSDDDSS